MADNPHGLPLRRSDGQLQHILCATFAAGGGCHPFRSYIRVLRIPTRLLDHGRPCSSFAGLLNIL